MSKKNKNSSNGGDALRIDKHRVFLILGFSDLTIAGKERVNTND